MARLAVHVGARSMPGARAQPPATPLPQNRWCAGSGTGRFHGGVAQKNDQRLDVVLAEASAAHPAVRFEAPVVAAHLARIGVTLAEPSPLSPDLALVAQALAHRDDALRALDAVFRRAARGLGRIGGDDALEDVLSHARELLLLGDQRPPRLTQYRGQSPLQPWLKTSLVRMLLNLRRRKEQPAGPDLVEQLAARLEQSRGLDDGALRKRHGPEFKRCFRAAFEALDERQRDVLRRSTRGESIDAIGALHQVHRATAARWVNDAKAALREGTLSRLREALELSGTEAQSLARTLRAADDLSVSRLLGLSGARAAPAQQQRKARDDQG